MYFEYRVRLPVIEPIVVEAANSSSISWPDLLTNPPFWCLQRVQPSFRNWHKKQSMSLVWDFALKQRSMHNSLASLRQRMLQKNVIESVPNPLTQARAHVSGTRQFELKHQVPHQNQCETFPKFNGRKPYNILNHRFGLKPKTCWAPTPRFAEELLSRIKRFFHKTKKNHAVMR